MKFKRLIVLLLITISGFLLTSCEQETIKVIVPMGGPSYALHFMTEEYYEKDEVLGADPLVAAFGSKDYEVIIAPTNLGAKFYNMSPDYQLLASIVWGNLYLVSENELSIDDLDGKTIKAFGQNQTPDIILNYILEEKNINLNVEYLSSISEVISSFSLDKSGIYLLTEPQLSSLDSDNELNYIDLQEVYKEITGTNAYPQASVFVRSDLSRRTIRQIELDINNSIYQFNDEVNYYLVFNQLGLSMEGIKRSHVDYQRVEDIKDDVETYLQIIIDFNSNILSELPDENFYK